VIGLDVSAYTIPTDTPEADGTLEWTSTTLVLVEASADAHTGIGWTYGPATIAEVVTSLLAPEVCETGVLDPPAAHERMCRAVRNAGRPGMCSMAISAIDCALWDLKARHLGLPLHRLLGAVHDEVPVYGSGGFTTYDTARMREQLGHWTAGRHIPRVKIKIVPPSTVRRPTSPASAGSRSSSASPGWPAPTAGICPPTAPRTCTSPPWRRSPTPATSSGSTTTSASKRCSSTALWTRRVEPSARETTPPASDWNSDDRTPNRIGSGERTLGAAPKFGTCGTAIGETLIYMPLSVSGGVCDADDEYHQAYAA
jgi:hypothetical protein